jgi:hypothetical protein
MRKINHPEAANELVSENVKEMSNPTRDGRAMIKSTGEFGRRFTRGMRARRSV